MENTASSTAVLNSIGIDLSSQLHGVSLDSAGFGAYALEDAQLDASVHNDLGALVENMLLDGPDPDTRALPSLYLEDVLRLSGQASVTRLAGFKALNAGAYLVDGLRLSAQARNLASGELLSPAGPLAYVADQFRSSGATVDAALDGLAGANLLSSRAYVLDAARLSGQVTNRLFGSLLDPGAALYASDSMRSSGPTLGAALTRAAGAEALGANAYVIDSLRLSKQVSNDLVTSVLDRAGTAGGHSTLAYLHDVARLSSQTALDNAAGLSVAETSARVLDSLRLDAHATNDLLADIVSSNSAEDLRAHLTGTASPLLDIKRESVTAAPQPATPTRAQMNRLSSAFAPLLRALSW